MDIIERLKNNNNFDEKTIESVFGDIKQKMDKLENERAVIILKSKDSGILTIAFAKRDKEDESLLNIGYMGLNDSNNYTFQEKYSDILKNDIKNYEVVTAFGQNSDLSKEISAAMKERNMHLKLNKYLESKIQNKTLTNKRNP